MGALLAFAGEGGPPADAWARARRVFEEEIGLPVAGEADGVVKYGRLHGAASPLALADDGWLAVAGTWVHADVATDDTDALLAAGVPDDLDGQFAAVRRQGDATTVTTDPFGRLHLFAAETDAGVLLATSAVALAAAVGAEPDPDGVYEFLASGTLYEDRTVFAGVRRLPGGRTYAVVGGRLRETGARALLPTGGGPDRSPGELADAMIAAWEPLMERVLATYDGALPDLTGGVDSRLVLGLLARRGHTCDVTVTGADDDPDVVVARRLADGLGLTLRHVSRDRVETVQSTFAKARRGAALAECGYDAVQYAWIADLHAAHAATYAASINGSGGEMLRNYWWGARSAGRTDADPIGPGLRRFAGLSLDPHVLKDEHRRDVRAHFRAVFERSLAPRAGEPFHVLMDHLYLDLRMQCWQGGLASASNRIWPVVSPLLWAAPLALVFAARPQRRLGGRLTAALMERFPRLLRDIPLDTGFPPARPALSNFWRFLPGLTLLPGRFWPRVRNRIRPRPPETGAGAAIVRALCADGAAAFLAPERFPAASLLDADRYAAFHRDACATGEVSLALFGRLLALAAAYGAAFSR